MFRRTDKKSYRELRQDIYDEHRMIRQYHTFRKFKLTYTGIKFWKFTPRLYRPFYGSYKQFDEWFKLSSLYKELTSNLIVEKVD